VAMLVMLLLCAPSIGSFLGVLVKRLPQGRGVVFERSRCDACGAALHFWEMVPVVGWLLLRGRCVHCGVSISPFYPVIEIAAVVVVLLAGSAVAGLELLVASLSGWLLLVVTAAPWKARLRIPGRTIVLPALIVLSWTLWFAALYANFKR
jgi:leader peptidase (prepilin peptidase) / N-methyltransferase